MDVILHQDKFHKIIYRTYRVNKIDRKTQTIRNLLCYYQEMACNKYPNEAMFTYILGKHYDAKFRVSLTTFGSYSLIEYTLVAIDPIYINDKEYTKESLEQLFIDSCVPVITNDDFDEDLFTRVYEIYESDLLAKEDSHQSMALKETMKAYFGGTNRDFDNIGNLDDLKNITKEDLYNYYLNVQKEESISILSSLDETKVDESNITLTPKSNYHFKQRNNVKKKKIINQVSSQCYLQIIYETKTFASDELYYPMLFLNYIFGGASSSYLFKIVREKYGLCYAINSMYLGGTGIIVIVTILNKKDLDKAIAATHEALEYIKSGDFDIEEIRNHYISVYKANTDFQETSITNYISDNYFLESPKSSEELDSILKVTKEDILKCANIIEEAFICAYGGDIDE